MPIVTNPTFATGDTIEAVFANNLRDSDLVLDTRTGGDPGVAGLFLASSGALGGVWRVLATGDYPDGSVTDAKMANQKLSLTGGTLSGGLAFSAGGITLAGGSQIIDSTALVIGANGDTFLVTTENGVTQLLNIDPSHLLYKGNTVWHAANDGSGSGLDADFVRGLAPASMTVGAATTYTGANGGTMQDDALSTILKANGNIYVVTNEAGTTAIFQADLSNFTYKGSQIWTAGNDGSGSGLDADLLHALTPGNGNGNIPISNGTINTNLNADTLHGLTIGHVSGTIAISDGTLNANLNAELHGGLLVTALARLGAASNFTVAPTIGGATVWDAANDGSGSGLDADTIDGIDSSVIALLNATNDFSVAPTIQGDAIAKIKAGTYNGNSSTQAITGVGFAPKKIDIMDDAGTLTAVILNGFVLSFPAGGASASATVTMGSDGWTFANAANGTNTSGHAYHYIAYGF